VSAYRWAILTGEYPPQAGGVSDYTRQVARALAQAGDDVHVWAPPAAGTAPADPGVQVHRLPDHFGSRGLRQLDIELDSLPGPVRILVQYVPHAFGRRAMNLPFAFWLRSRRRQPVWVLFHEVAFPWGPWYACRQNLLAAVTRHMAWIIARAADQVFVSIPAWEAVLAPLSRPDCRPRWLPIPSNCPTEVDRGRVEKVRSQIAGESPAVLLGHFGTFGSHSAEYLRPVLVALLRNDRRRIALLVGHRASAFVSRLGNEAPELAPRIHARDGLPPEQVVTHLAACDLLLQPYPDGVSSRRSSLMCGLALGLPMLTTEGPLSEPLWRESGAVALAPVSPASQLLAAAETLLADPEQRRRLGECARELYRNQFALEHTIRILRSDDQRPVEYPGVGCVESARTHPPAARPFGASART
jgi:glycosyltransferase involved in cell wall biosynthesis